MPDMPDDDYRRQYADAVEPVRYAAGRHGTPDWNPRPHPLAHPDAVERRAADPLWMYHRGLIDYGGRPNAIDGYRTWESPNSHQVIHHSQLRPHEHDPAYAIEPPEGLHRWTDSPYQPHARGNGNKWDTADIELTDRGYVGDPRAAAFSPNHAANRDRYYALFGHGGGRRPWYNAVFPLQDLESLSHRNDPYRLLAASVMSGNRHAVGPLVDLLKRRDNPAGWSPVWAALHKAMTERIGELSEHEVRRRVGAVASTISRWDGGSSLAAHADAAAAHAATGDFFPYQTLTDHLRDHGHDAYADMIHHELTNVLPHLRNQPKGRRRF